jgi:hypothetical protein
MREGRDYAARRTIVEFFESLWSSTENRSAVGFGLVFGQTKRLDCTTLCSGALHHNTQGW